MSFTCSCTKIAKTGALCCVAAGPHGTKSSSVSGERSMDHNEPHWRINSSFSPPLQRRWECGFHPDGLPRVTNGAAIYVPSASSPSMRSRSGVSNEHYPNHHHSVSDGALSYYGIGSPSDNRQVPRWMPPVQRYDFGEFSTPSGGARPGASVFSQGNERRYTSRVLSTPSSLGSTSPLSESSHWVSTGHPHNFSGRRSFMTKPVYPLVCRNPVSDGENHGIASSTALRSSFSPDLKFHKALTQLQRMDASPDPSASSYRREGFRWSNASSYDFGFNGDTIDTTEHIGLDAPRSPYISSSEGHQKCALCERPMWQKSPWSTHCIVRSGDMPVAGILPCRHVFHAECLEESTHKSQIHEPPCPICQRPDCGGGIIPFSEPLQVALRSVRKSQGVSVPADGAESSSSADHELSVGGDTRRNQSLSMMQRRGGSLLKSHFKNRFPFKGKIGRGLFGVRTPGKDTSSPSSSLVRDSKLNRPGRLRH